MHNLGFIFKLLASIESPCFIQNSSSSPSSLASYPRCGMKNHKQRYLVRTTLHACCMQSLNNRVVSIINLQAVLQNCLASSLIIVYSKTFTFYTNQSSLCLNHQSHPHLRIENEELRRFSYIGANFPPRTFFGLFLHTCDYICQ